jgi:hypothetical protein
VEKKSVVAAARSEWRACSLSPHTVLYFKESSRVNYFNSDMNNHLFLSHSLVSRRLR